MIYIWVRRTIDWEDEEAALAQLTDQWRKSKIPLWNATFNISYQRFRHRVAEIARLNHSRVAGAKPADWDEIPDGALVLPVDDDDWFDPDAAHVLEAERDFAASAYLWRSRWLEVPIDLGHRLHILRRRVVPSTPPKWLCGTNNYAMVKHHGSREQLDNHLRASRWFEDRMARGGEVVKRIERDLGVANRTLASQTTLRQTRYRIRRSELVRKYRRYRSLYRRPPPEDLTWCEPYLALMDELMGELEVISSQNPPR